jgi:hypothetical protein
MLARFHSPFLSSVHIPSGVHGAAAAPRGWSTAATSSASPRPRSGGITVRAATGRYLSH